MAGMASRMYKKSPKLGRGEDGEVEISRIEQDKKTTDGDEHMEKHGGTAGTEEMPHHIRHAHERHMMHAKHEHEHAMADHYGHDKTEMHERHEKERSEMHERHEKEMKAGSMEKAEHKE